MTDNKTMLKFAPLGMGIHSIEADKVFAFGKKVANVLNVYRQKAVEVGVPVAVGAAVTVAMVAGAGAVKALEAVANLSADAHDALVHKLTVMDAVHNKEVKALFNEPQDSEGQVLVMHAYVDDKNDDSIGQ